MIPQLHFDHDLIEVPGNKCFKLSSRQFVATPFVENDIGKVSPRCFQDFDTSANCDGGYFSSSIFNSFPDLNERIRFLNKFYQCLLFCQLPHKVTKLVVVGDSDSGKSSWARIFLGIIPRNKVILL